MKKIVLLTNGLGPYRIELYDYLYEFLKKKKIKFEVWCESDNDYNKHWRYENYRREYTKLLDGIKIKYKNTFFYFNYEIKKLLKQESIDFLIIAGSWATPTNFFINTKKIKVIFWSESNLYGMKRTNFIEEKIWSFFRKRFYRNIKYFMVPGIRAKEAVIKWRNLKRAPVFIEFPNTIEEIEYKLTRKFREQKIFLIPARLTKVKGIYEFLENSLELIKNKNIKIIISGTGELEKKIKELLLKNNIENKVELTGFVDSKQLATLYSQVDFFLLPSLYDPSPLVAIEALYYRLPVLVSDKIGNLPEILLENGYKFDTNNKQSIEKSILNAINWNEEQYMLASEKSYEIYLKNFKKKRIVCNWYKKILEIESESL